MRYDWVAIASEDVPVALEKDYQHLIDTYASETNKTASMWRAIPENHLDFRPHEKCNSLRSILVHQILSERRFFAEFVGTREPGPDGLLPEGKAPGVQDYLDQMVQLARLRLPQFAQGSRAWWMEVVPFFGGLERQRIWVFWRRLLHTCHHRTQVQTWLRLAGVSPVPAIYGPSGDMTWEDADPTTTIEAAVRRPPHKG